MLILGDFNIDVKCVLTVRSTDLGISDHKTLLFDLCIQPPLRPQRHHHILIFFFLLLISSLLSKRACIKNTGHQLERLCRKPGLTLHTLVCEDYSLHYREALRNPRQWPGKAQSSFIFNKLLQLAHGFSSDSITRTLLYIDFKNFQKSSIPPMLTDIFYAHIQRNLHLFYLSF